MPPSAVVIGRKYTSSEPEHFKDGRNNTRKSIFRTHLGKAPRYTPTFSYKEGRAPRVPVSSSDPSTNHVVPAQISEMKSRLLFIVMIAEVFAAGTQRDSRHFFNQGATSIEKAAEGKAEVIEEPERSFLELLTGLTSSAISKLLEIETLVNVVNSLPMATLYNRAISTDLSQLRDDPSETSDFLAHTLLTALDAANGPENLPATEDFIKMTIKMYIDVCVALFAPYNSTEDIEHTEERRQLKKYLVRALSRGSSGEIRGLTIKANGQTLLSPRSTLSAIGWTLNTMPNFKIPLIIVLQKIPILEIDSMLQEFDSSPESVDALANFLTGVAMDLVIALDIDPFFFTQEFYLAELITTKIQLSFALYDLLDGKPSDKDGEAVVKRLLLNALT